MLDLGSGIYSFHYIFIRIILEALKNNLKNIL